MTLDWDVIERRAHRGDGAGVAALILGAAEAERRAFFGAVQAGIKSAGASGWWRSDHNPAPGFALAVIGTAPSASSAAALLTRRDMREFWPWMPTERILAIAAARELTWLGDLGLRLARRLPTRDVWDSAAFDFTAAILQAGGAEPPVIEGVVRGWLAGLIRPHGECVPPLSVRMGNDRHLDVLLPAVFEIDGMGVDIHNASWGLPAPSAPFPDAVSALVATGRLDRKTVLAATVGRLARTDKPHALRPFVQLHEKLAPTVDEIAEYSFDYARLLAEGPGPLATLAQTMLRTLDDAGRLELDTLLEASVPALLRTEKTVVKAQLIWLDKVARRQPGRADEVCETVATAFGHPALDLQERALTQVTRQLPRLTPDTVARLAEAAVMLAGDLPARAAAVFGTAPPVAEPAGVPALPLCTGPAAMPAPITSAAELAGEIAVLPHDQAGIRWERVLAALVALHAAGERDALAAALTPLIERHSDWFLENQWNGGSVFVALGTAIRMAIDPPRHDGSHQRFLSAVRTAWQDGRRGGANSNLSSEPYGVLELRAAEIAVHINGAMMPMLVATPTRVNGSIDAEVLLARLSRAEAEGWQPWPFDLEQALLRLPRSPAPAEVTAGAAALTSPAGRQFAQWLASGGLPDPVSEPFEQRGERNVHGVYSWGVSVPRRMGATLRPVRDGGLRLERQLLTHDPRTSPERSPGHSEGIQSVLTMVLPHHREVIAAWFLGDLGALADQGQRGAGALMPLLADCTGPVGPGMAYGLAYTFGAKQAAARAAAVDAFLTLAAGAAPFAAAVGAALGDLCADGSVKLSRVTPALTDAHRAGASAAVWELLTTALPLLLPTVVRAVPELLELATQVAVAIGARAEIPGLAEAAARPGSGRLVQEARRLHTTLGG